MNQNAPRPSGRWLLRHLIIDFWLGIPNALTRSPAAFFHGLKWCACRLSHTLRELSVLFACFLYSFSLFYLSGSAALLWLPGPLSSPPNTALIPVSKEACFKIETLLRASQASENDFFFSMGKRIQQPRSDLAPWLPARPVPPATASQFCHEDSEGFFIVLKMEPFLEHPMLALDPRRPDLVFPMAAVKSIFERSGASLHALPAPAPKPSMKLYGELIGASPPTAASRAVWTFGSFRPPPFDANAGIAGQVAGAIIHHGMAAAGIGFCYWVGFFGLLLLFNKLRLISVLSASLLLTAQISSSFVLHNLLGKERPFALDASRSSLLKSGVDAPSARIKARARNIAIILKAKSSSALSGLKTHAAKLLRKALCRSHLLLPFLGLSLAAGMSFVVALHDGQIFWTPATEAECLDVNAHAASVAARNAKYISAISCRRETSGPIVSATVLAERTASSQKITTGLNAALSKSIGASQWTEAELNFKPTDLKLIVLELLGYREPTSISRPAAHAISTQFPNLWRLALAMLLGALLITLPITILVFFWRALRTFASGMGFMLKLVWKAIQAILAAFWDKASDAEFISRAEFRELAKMPKNHSPAPSGETEPDAKHRKSRRL